MGLFGNAKQKPPKELCREWTSKIRKEKRVLDRQINGIQREEEKAKRACKDAAKKGHKDVCAIYAKEIVQSRKAVGRIYAAKAQMTSVEYSMQQQLAQLRMAGALQQSAEVMKSMQSLVKVGEVSATMREMSKEMMKAGIIEEMMEDAFEMDDDEEMEEAAQEEVDKILFELTAGKLGEAPAVAKDSLPEPKGATALEPEEEEEVSEMQARLEALRS